MPSCQVEAEGNFAIAWDFPQSWHLGSDRLLRHCAQSPISKKSIKPAFFVPWTKSSSELTLVIWPRSAHARDGSCGCYLATMVSTSDGANRNLSADLYSMRSKDL